MRLLRGPIIASDRMPGRFCVILSNTLLSRYFSVNVYFEGNLDSANKFDNLWKFGGRSVSSLVDIEEILWSLPPPPPGRRNRVNIILCIFSCFPSCNDRMTFFPFAWFPGSIWQTVGLMEEWKWQINTRCLHQSSQATQKRTLGSSTRKATWRGGCTSLIWGHYSRVQPTWTGLQSESHWG